MSVVSSEFSLNAAHSSLAFPSSRSLQLFYMMMMSMIIIIMMDVLLSLPPGSQSVVRETRAGSTVRGCSLQALQK